MCGTGRAMAERRVSAPPLPPPEGGRGRNARQPAIRRALRTEYRDGLKIVTGEKVWELGLQ